MHRLRKYLFLFLLLISGIGVFFSDISLSQNTLAPTSFSNISVDIHFGGSETYAQTSTTNSSDTTEAASSGEKEWNDFLNNFVYFIDWITGIVTVISSIFVALVGWLLTPDWTSGDLFGIRKHLYALWITVSNIIYFIYAIALIVIAIMTMFNSKNYGYRQLLPKLVLGILMVPFTWWIVQWSISLSTVVTTSVLSIPMETLQSTQNENSWWETAKIPKCTSFGSPSDKDITTAACSNAEYVSPKEFVKDGAGIYGNLIIYSYGVFKLDKAKNLSTGGVNPILTAADIIHQGFISVIMYLIFGILIIALGAVLFVRVFKLWTYAIFSPLFTFGIVFKGLLKSQDEDGLFTINEFLGLVFLPALIGLILSFGLILINALNSGDQTGKSGFSGEECSSERLKSEEGCTILSLAGNPQNKITQRLVQANGKDGQKESFHRTLTVFQWGGMEMQWYGNGKMDESEVLDKAQSVGGFFSKAGGALGVLFLDFIALMFIWMSFMAARGISKTAKTVLEPIARAGKDIRQTVAKAPMYAKIPGIGNLQGVGLAANRIAANRQQAANDAFNNSKIGKALQADRHMSKGDEAKIQTESAKGRYTKESIKNIHNVFKSKEGATLVNNMDDKTFIAIKKSLKQNTEADIKNWFDPSAAKKLISIIKKKDLSHDDKVMMAAILRGWEGIGNKSNAQAYLDSNRTDKIKAARKDDSDTPDGGDEKKDKDNDSPEE